jgi:ribonuclease P protein component
MSAFQPMDPESQGTPPSSAALDSTFQPEKIKKILTRKFPKSARLLTNSHYKYMQRNSSRHFGELIAIDFRQGKSSPPKLGITVSKKFGKAHDRNRFKRVVREAFRELYPFLPQDLEINISPRKSGISLTKQAALTEIQSLLLKIQSTRH